MGDVPQQQWAELFASALDDYPVAGVKAVVEWHVGRPPTRSELSAARRAVTTMKTHGQITDRMVLIPGSDTHPARRYLLVGRAHLDPQDWPPVSVLQAAARHHPPPSPLSPRAARELMLNALYEAAGRVDHIAPARSGPNSRSEWRTRWLPHSPNFR